MSCYSVKRRASGFTLVELMISLALMVILMLAINYIFTSVGQATGSAQAVSKNTKDAQGAQTVFYEDISKIVLDDGPCMLISSQVQPAFRNQKDQLGAIDPTNPSIVEDGSGGSLTQSSGYTNDRSHRTDILSFFARGVFNRQTGNDGVFVADQSAREAWIWYGHLNLNNNNDTTPTPFRVAEGTSQTNPNNFYSSQWILGRVAMLLAEPFSPIVGGTPKVYDINGNEQRFYKRKTPAGQHSLAPLSQGSEVDDSALQIHLARYDVAGTTIALFKNYLQDFVDDKFTASDNNWYSGMMLNDVDTSTFVTHARRFNASTYAKKPFTSAEFASMGPIFLPGCAQFIVEYAGDFLTQNPDGTIVAPYGSDGTTDFIAVTNGTTVSRQIRWYGMPRDTNKDNVIAGTGNTNQMVDVVPLRDVILAAPIPMPIYAATGPDAFIEKAWPTAVPAANYLAPGVMPTDFQNAYKTGVYRVAWGPDRGTQPYPSLIRITIILDDPNGRLKDPPSYEYVFRLK